MKVDVVKIVSLRFHHRATVWGVGVWAAGSVTVLLHDGSQRWSKNIDVISKTYERMRIHSKIEEFKILLYILSCWRLWLGSLHFPHWGLRPVSLLWGLTPGIFNIFRIFKRLKPYLISYCCHFGNHEHVCWYEILN